MPSYPGPSSNPLCQCPNPMAQMFCPNGHMTECHAGLTCAQAGCGHLGRYDLDEKEVRVAQAEATRRLEAGELRPYCLVDGVVTIEPPPAGTEN